MTFSIAGFCQDTGQLGIAITSSSIAVGARCPWLLSGVGAVSTQNITLPSLGHDILDLLQAGQSPEMATTQALNADRWHDYRQLAVIDSHGRTYTFTGAGALGTHYAAQGRNCVAAGNLLADACVVDAMLDAFARHVGTLPDRLVKSLAAGLAAGGEAGPVRSAALKVVGDVSWAIVDLRVDWHEACPIYALDQLWQAYRPQMNDYVTRALNPAAAPSYGVPGDE